MYGQQREEKDHAVGSYIPKQKEDQTQNQKENHDQRTSQNLYTIETNYDILLNYYCIYRQVVFVCIID